MCYLIVSERVRITFVILVAPYRGLFGSKIDQKTHIRNQNQVPGPATSFLAGETVGFCLNAPAGPIQYTAPMLCHMTSTSSRYRVM